MVSKDNIKNAYRSLTRVDRKQVKDVLCEKFGYKERNFQAKMSGLYSWTKAEVGLLKCLLELEGA